MSVTSNETRSVVLCPICGKRNYSDQTFSCRKCGREGLCKRHLNGKAEACVDCVPFDTTEKDSFEIRRRNEFLSSYEREFSRMQSALRNIDSQVNTITNERASLTSEIKDLSGRLGRLQKQVDDEKKLIASGQLTGAGGHACSANRIRTKLKENGETSGWYEGPVDTHGLPNGRGTFVFDDGSVYEGNFFYGARAGMGRMKYPRGAIYEGGFHMGRWSGEGCYTWPDGTRYIGSFMDNKFHGRGKQINPDGSVIEGVYEFGELVRRD